MLRQSSTSAGIEATSKLYRSITSIAPLAVQKEWETMTSNVEAAATVDPTDPASVQKVADMTRSSQQRGVVDLRLHVEAVRRHVGSSDDHRAGGRGDCGGTP